MKSRTVKLDLSSIRQAAQRAKAEIQTWDPREQALVKAVSLNLASSESRAVLRKYYENAE